MPSSPDKPARASATVAAQEVPTDDLPLQILRGPRVGARGASHPHAVVTRDELPTHYVPAAARLRPGHQLTVLSDGREAYPAMLAAIDAATRSVHLESYIFETDAVGRRFVDALVARARAGVEVRVLVDGVGSFGFEAAMGPELRDAGVELSVYAPLRRRWSLRRWLRRDHRKILVVDGERAFVGGINIGMEYAPLEEGGGGWRDTHMEVRGPAVSDLETMFRQTWAAARGRPMPTRAEVAAPPTAVAGLDWAMAIGTRVGRRKAIRRHIVHALRQARTRAWIASAYFVPDPGLRRAMRAAARRGVDVRVIVPGDSDLRSVQWAGEYTYAGLLRAGVRVLQWFEGHMHAKTAVIDGVWSMVGSYNLDYVSLRFNQEVVVVALGETIGASLDASYQRDMLACREVDLQSWLARHWWQRAMAWFFYRFRRFL